MELTNFHERNGPQSLYQAIKTLIDELRDLIYSPLSSRQRLTNIDILFDTVKLVTGKDLEYQFRGQGIKKYMSDCTTLVESKELARERNALSLKKQQAAFDALRTFLEEKKIVPASHKYSLTRTGTLRLVIKHIKDSGKAQNNRIPPPPTVLENSATHRQSSTSNPLLFPAQMNLGLPISSFPIAPMMFSPLLPMIPVPSMVPLFIPFANNVLNAILLNQQSQETRVGKNSSEAADDNNDKDDVTK